tara:strand:- start:1696 stop:2349 length:654 start_codon:yes stop_codon:yes gene_type:complete
MTDLHSGFGVNPFFTFDPFDCEGILELLTVLDSTDEDFNQFLNDNQEILTRIKNQGIKNPKSRNDIPWDDANLIFISSKSPQSKLHPAFGSGKPKERLGRIPTSEGNPLSYLLMYLLTPKTPEGEKMLNLLSQLHSGFSKSIHGHNRFSLGKWGMNLQGYLLQDDVINLHEYLKKLKWTISAEETLDGGVRTFANDLSIILRDAKKHQTGVLMRSHN